MNYLEHEYLVPVIIGGGREATSVAKTVYKATRIKPHVFADKFSLWQKIFCFCHRVSPMKSGLLTLSLISFAESLEEYYFPIIICDEKAAELVKKNSEIIGSFYIIKDLNELT